MIYENYIKLEKFIKNLENKQNSIIMILNKAQELFGYIPKEVQNFISEETDVSIEKIQEIINFYDFFLENPKSKYAILICMGVKCHKKDSVKLKSEVEKYLGIENGNITEDGLFSIRETGCMSACANGPIVIIGNKLITKANILKIKEEIEKIREKELS